MDMTLGRALFFFCAGVLVGSLVLFVVSDLFLTSF